MVPSGPVFSEKARDATPSGKSKPSLSVSARTSPVTSLLDGSGLGTGPSSSSKSRSEHPDDWPAVLTADVK